MSEIRTMCSSDLRASASASWLKKQIGPVIIQNGRKHEPVAVLVPYDMYLRWQEELAETDEVVVKEETLWEK